MSVGAIDRVVAVDFARDTHAHSPFLSLSATGSWLSNSPVSVTSGVNIGSRFVDFRVDGESCGVDGFFADYDFSVFVDEDEVANADLGEVS
jgi:hypothetical protein